MTRHLLASPILLISLAVGLAGCGASESAKDGGQVSTDSPSSEKGTCDYIADTMGTPAKKVDAPPADPPYSGQVKAGITTRFGRIPLLLDADKAPCAVSSFLSLASQRYYDGSPCNRVVYKSGLVGILQCGDPTGTGTGGPGYVFAEEVTGQEKYGPGVIAMAKRDAPSSTGGQFFIMFDDSTKAFPSEYTIIGKVADQAGLAVLKKAGAAAVAGKPNGYDGTTATPIVLTTVRAG